MIKIPFKISKVEQQELLSRYPNLGKNSDVGKLAVEIAKLYFLDLYSTPSFKTNVGGVDLTVSNDGIEEIYEIKGTADKEICWHKIKVSSQNCYNRLVGGMTLIRITNIGATDMDFYFMKHFEDFELVSEPRWSVKPSKS